MARTQGRVWFVTGSTSGLGRALVQAALNAGERVAATARQPERLLDLGHDSSSRLLPLQLDVTRPAQVSTAVGQTVREFGRIDVVVNNAGYGMLGALDAVSGEELREQMETNFFAAVSVTRATLPILREQRAGHFFFMSSVAGQIASAGAGAYAASKFALEGFAEALHEETVSAGIAVTIVEPGPFRTEWSGKSLRMSNQPGQALSTREIEAQIRQAHGRQAGDPALAAAAILSAADMTPPPLRLPLGREAYGRLRKDLYDKLANLERLKSLILSTDNTDEGESAMTASHENQRTGWVTSVTIDCHDPESLARFWAQLLGLEVCPRRSRYVSLGRPPTLTPELVFQPVPEPKQGKARMHLDIGVHDLEESRRLALELGATIADDLENDDPQLHVLRDPEGNEFCLVYKPSDTEQA